MFLMKFFNEIYIGSTGFFLFFSSRIFIETNKILIFTAGKEKKNLLKNAIQYIMNLESKFSL